jgi:thymidylate synthase (FAD)
MNWKDIRVWMVQHSVPDREALLAYIREFPECESHALPENATDMELVPACAAKRCYMSFEPGANLNVTRVRRDLGEFFANVLRSKHGSILEHSSYTFAIEGVTRVFTGEMNRHRAGVAISEGSMRFILQNIERGIDVWLPLSLRECADDDEVLAAKKRITRRSFVKIFTTIEDVYQELAGAWEIDKLPMSEKKKVTSMLRRILPMGCCTGGFWSMNVRAMRHIVTMRTSPAAEEEIAHVFRKIARELVRNEPNLFGDFVEKDGAWVPEHDKV